MLLFSQFSMNFVMHACIYVVIVLPLVATTRFKFTPKFYAQDSAIIVDADKPLPQPLKVPTLVTEQTHYSDVNAIPVYDIIMPSPSTTTTAKNLISINDAEFPHDLLVIAKQKLGLKSIDEIPSITELAELLGTNNAEETIAYIRQLTNTEQGIALMKAYIESTDYTDNAGDSADKVTTQTAAPISKEIKNEQPTAAQGILGRMYAYFNNLLPQHQEHVVKAVANMQHAYVKKQQQQQNSQKPLLVRRPLPYHYPIPLRPMPLQNHQQQQQQHTHLNTPKYFTHAMPPHIQQLARLARIPPKKLEHFLRTKPKLAELAAKVSRFPIANERGALMNEQVMAAVQQAMEQDADLKKLLNAHATLK